MNLILSDINNRLVLTVFALNFMFFFFSCNSRKENSSVVIIADTLHNGTYYKDMGIRDLPLFSVIDLHLNDRITSVRDKKEYLVKFDVSNLNDYPIRSKLLKNGSLKESSKKGEYILQVERKDDSEFLELFFSFDLEGDSILIQHRNWIDTTKTEFKEKFTGYIPKNLLKIKIHPSILD